MRAWAAVVLAIVVVSACGRGTEPQVQQPTGAQPPPQGRTLVAALKTEPATIAARQIQEASGVGLYLTDRMFNAYLVLLDGDARPRPYLVEALPQLDTESWRLFPDGRMETTFRLKPGLTWHDGAPFTSDDVLFAWQLYGRPDLGLARRLPMDAIESVVAPDPLTAVFTWKRPYPDAGTLTDRNGELPPLPRHILQSAFEDASAEALINHPYWNREFVGLGAYRLDRWEPGSFLEASAFDNHVLGRAKIARIKVAFISDAQAVVANLLTGEVHLAAIDAVRLDQALTLRQTWADRRGGDFAGHPSQWRAVFFQFRPDLVNPRALLNPSVRKALAHAIDRQAINDAVYGGTLELSDSMISSRSRWGEAVGPVTVRYPYDLRRTDQLMTAAGFAKVGGVYSSPSDGAFVAELKTNGAPDNEREMQIMASGWREAGFTVMDAVLPIAQAQDNYVRSTFPGMYSNNGPLGDPALLNHASSRIPGPDNRWNGSNRGGWTNAEYDRLIEGFNSTLAHAERAQLVAQMVQHFTDDVGGISLFFRVQPWVYVAGLSGLEKPAAPETMQAWNVHEWEFR